MVRRSLTICEILAVATERPWTFGAVLSWALEVERLGIAGFGWGVAWTPQKGELRSYRAPISLRDDAQGRSRLSDLTLTRALVHLRRPSRLSTIQLADTQPFVDAGGGLAFVHNGTFARDNEYRARFGHLLKGRADSEVGFHVFASLLADTAPSAALVGVHQALGGSANLGYMVRQGHLLLYGGHPGNSLYRFRLDGVHLACTNLHSDDDSLFELVFPKATERQVIGGEAQLLPG